MQLSSSKSSPFVEPEQSISRKQIQNFFTNDYDATTTKEDVKYALKRLVKRNCITKYGEKAYSCIQLHQISDGSISSEHKTIGYQKVDEHSDDVAAGDSIDRLRTTGRDIESASLDDNILSYIRDYCQSSSSTSSVLQQSISKKQIQKYYDSIVNEYDTTKKDVKHSLKRLIKRNVIIKDGKKKYSYIQQQQSSRDICTVIATNRTNKRKRQSEERNDDVSASTTESKKKYFYPRCLVDGCNNQVQNKGICIKHGAKVKKCKREGCDNNAKKGGVCVKHWAIVKPRKKCEYEGCNNNVQQLGVCKQHGAYS